MEAVDCCGPSMGKTTLAELVPAYLLLVLDGLLQRLWELINDLWVGCAVLDGSKSQPYGC